MERQRTVRGLRTDIFQKQKDIAEKLGISTVKYNGIEQTLDDEELLSKLAEALQVKKIEVHIIL